MPGRGSCCARATLPVLRRPVGRGGGSRVIPTPPHSIQTNYKGCRFRSRLEARWAVFLDHLHVPWEYEPEGYRLDNGRCYLPDFWLPSQRGWLEIKGQKPEPSDDAWVKAKLLAQETEQSVTVFCGQISDNPNNLVGLRFSPWMKGDKPACVWWFCCPSCGTWGTASHVEELWCSCWPFEPRRDRRLVSAVRAARSARFEFGENDQ